MGSKEYLKSLIDQDNTFLGISKKSKGLKQKLKEVEESFMNEIKSSRDEIEAYKSISSAVNEMEPFDEKIERLKEELMSVIENNKAENSLRFEKQRRDLLHIQEEFRKAKNESQALQHSFIVIQRRLQVLEDEIGE